MADITMAWGKCTVKFFSLASGNAAVGESDGYVPVDGTTTLNVTEGEKTEAKEEGGGVVAVKYAKNTYELQFALREKITGISDDDGVITTEYKVTLTPETSGAPVLTIAKAHITLVESFSSSDGWQFTYKCSALRVDNASAISIS